MFDNLNTENVQTSLSTMKRIGLHFINPDLPHEKWILVVLKQPRKGINNK